MLTMMVHRILKAFHKQTRQVSFSFFDCYYCHGHDWNSLTANRRAFEWVTEKSIKDTEKLAVSIILNKNNGRNQNCRPMGKVSPWLILCHRIVSNLFSSEMYRFDSDSILPPQHHLSDEFGVNIIGWCPFGWKVSVLNSNFQSKFFSDSKKESRFWISKEKGQQSASKPLLACHRCVATANLALWLNHIQLFSSDQKNVAHFSWAFFCAIGSAISYLNS